MSHVKNVAIVGAGGLVGSQVTKYALDTCLFNLTAITREGSNSTFPKGMAVKKGDYTSSEFLESALQGQDVLIITLHVLTSPDIQTNFIRAAAKACVPWILPNEYGQDGDNEELNQAVPILASKKKYRDQIEESGTSSWIGIASNLWIDYGLEGGWFSVNIPERKATLYDDGETSIVTNTLPQVGRAIAKLLSLPIESSSSPSLSDYNNKFFYFKSFDISQKDMVAAAQRATNTKPEDWEITRMPVDDYIKESAEKLRNGNRMGMINILYGNTLKKGLGDQFHGREIANDKIGLAEENFDEVVRGVVQKLENN